MKGETILLDLSDEDHDLDQDFDAWEPDPVDADPRKTILIIVCIGLL